MVAWGMASATERLAAGHARLSAMVDRADLYRSPDVWGPKRWALLHVCGALATSDATLGPSWLGRVLQLLPPVLPCGSCQHNLRSHLGRWRRSDVDDVLDVVVWRLHAELKEMWSKATHIVYEHFQDPATQAQFLALARKRLPSMTDKF